MRFAVVGFGYWGRNYVRLLSHRPDAQLTLIADPSELALAEANIAANGARLSSSPLEAVTSEDVDAIVIATPATTHFDLAYAALRAGKAVLCEKPLGTGVSECEELVRVAEATRQTLFVGHTFLYSPAIQTMKQLLEDHELGLSIHAHASWIAPGPVRHDVNALWDLAPHPLSILTYLLGRPPTSVAATGQAILNGNREDIVFLHLDFDELGTADVHVSWLAPRKTRMLTLTGDRRLVVFDDSRTAKLQVYDVSIVRGDHDHQASQPRARFLPEEPVYEPEIDAAEPLAEQLDHFIGVCRSRPEDGRHALAGLDVVRVLEAAQASLGRDGKAVTVPTAIAAT